MPDENGLLSQTETLGEIAKELLQEKLTDIVDSLHDDFDIEEELVKVIDSKLDDKQREIERSIESGIEERLDDLDIEKKLIRGIADAINANEIESLAEPIIEEKIKSVFFNLLKDRDFVEELSKALFDHGA